ncbi:MAG: apolipoprotein N-acyltransferase [Candidatus Korobacteraceae bacterium]
MQVLIFPLPNWTFLAWAAIAPLMVAVLRARPAGKDWALASVRQSFALGYLAGVIWSFGTCYWIFNVMHNFGGLSAPVAAIVLVLFCLTLGLFLGMFAALLGALAGPGRLGRKAVLLSPVFWVAVELFRGYAVDFPWNPLGTVLVDNIPLSRLASATGVYGLSFEILLINVVFAIALLASRRQRVILLFAAVLASAMLQAGVLLEPPPLAADRTARLVQANVPILNSGGWTSERFQQTLTSLADLSVPRQGQMMPGEPLPGLIVWPESPAPFFLSDNEFLAAVGQVARTAKATVVVGSLGQPDPNDPVGKMFNSAAVVAPDGEVRARYDKVHLVPFGEYVPFQDLLSFAGKLTREVGDFVAGKQRAPVSVDGEHLGIFICYESVFPNDVRQFANNGAQVFVNISNDGWFGETAAPVQHLNMARMRAIENHRWLLRGTNTGITGVIDPYGRVLMTARRGVETSIDVPYTLVSQTTFYTRHGDWFAYGCAIISLALILLVVLRTRIRRA